MQPRHSHYLDDRAAASAIALILDAERPGSGVEPSVPGAEKRT